MVGWKLQEGLNTEPHQNSGLGHPNLEHLSLYLVILVFYIVQYIQVCEGRD